MGRLQSIIESARETIAGAFNSPARELEAATAQLRESFATIEGMMADDAGWRRPHHHRQRGVHPSRCEAQ